MTSFAENPKVNKYALLKQQVRNFWHDPLVMGEKPTFQMKFMTGVSDPQVPITNGEFLTDYPNKIADEKLREEVNKSLLIIQHIYFAPSGKATETAYQETKEKIRNTLQVFRKAAKYHKEEIEKYRERLKEDLPKLSPDIVEAENRYTQELMKYNPEEFRDEDRSNRVNRRMLLESLHESGFDFHEMRDAMKRYGHRLPYDHEETLAGYNDRINSERAAYLLMENVVADFEKVVVAPFQESGKRAR